MATLTNQTGYLRGYATFPCSSETVIKYLRTTHIKAPRLGAILLAHVFQGSPQCGAHRTRADMGPIVWVPTFIAPQDPLYVDYYYAYKKNTYASVY